MEKMYTVKMLALILALTLLMPLGGNALAAEMGQSRVNNYINYCSATIKALGNGRVQVSFSVIGTGVMDEIGVSSILLYTSTDQTNWSVAAVYPYNLNPSLVGLHTTSLSSSVSHGGVAGQYYKAYLCFWAGNDGVGEEYYKWTSVVRAT